VCGSRQVPTKLKRITELRIATMAFLSARIFEKYDRIAAQLNT
jgi:hypothetical protein